MFLRSVPQGNRNKNKNKITGPNQTYELLHRKENHKWKDNLQNRRKQVQTAKLWLTRTISKIYEQLTQLNNNHKKKESKYTKDLNRNFFKEDIQMAMRHIKRSKPQWGITSQLSGWLSSKSLQLERVWIKGHFCTLLVGI